MNNKEFLEIIKNIKQNNTFYDISREAKTTIINKIIKIYNKYEIDGIQIFGHYSIMLVKVNEFSLEIFSDESALFRNFKEKSLSEVDLNDFIK